MMIDTNSTDLDRLDKLCQKKTFSTLTPEEKQFVLKHVTEAEYIIMFEVYQTMHKNRTEDITPSESVKDKLNAAWQARPRRTRPFQLWMPVYQSAAAAVIFFLAGLGVSHLFVRTPEVIHDTLEVEVVKYVDRPIKEIQYIEVPAKKTPLQASQSQSIPLPEHVEEYWMAPESNSEVLRQQEITMANINLALNETNGMSLGDDTVLQKMMVTIR
jgi:hypothetical protein